MLLTVRVETGHNGLDFALVLLQLGGKLVTSALSAVWFGFTNKTVWLGLIIIVVAQGKSAIAALCWQQTNTHGHTTLWLPIYLMVKACHVMRLETVLNLQAVRFSLVLARHGLVRGGLS